MNCGNSDPAHPSYPHGRLEAARINTVVKNGKGLISHYNMNFTKTLAILNSSLVCVFGLKKRRNAKSCLNMEVS